MIHLLADLSARGLLAQATDPQLDAKLTALLNRPSAGEPLSAYAGFDPTADSLHIGHFLGILGLIYAQRNGLRPIAVVGGATGLIGDPSGKTTERQLLTTRTSGRGVAGAGTHRGRLPAPTRSARRRGAPDPAPARRRRR